MKVLPALLTLSAALLAAAPSAHGSDGAQTSAAAKGAEGENIAWKKTVIIYNKVIGREKAAKLQALLEPLVGHKIGLYPCEKEGGMNDPLPINATCIVLDYKYYYAFPNQLEEMRKDGWFSLRIGKRYPRKGRLCAYPGDIEIKAGGEGVEKAMQSLLDFLKPFIKEGRLTPLAPSCFKAWTSEKNKDRR